MDMQFLSFRVGEQQYAIDITAVQEIRRSDHVTAIAGSPPSILGVIELRGRVLPIVDLRAKFGLETGSTTRGAIVVLNETGGSKFGIAVDAVDSVLRLPHESIQGIPQFENGSVEERMFSGVVPNGSDLTLLIDVPALTAA